LAKVPGRKELEKGRMRRDLIEDRLILLNREPPGRTELVTNCTSPERGVEMNAQKAGKWHAVEPSKGAANAGNRFQVTSGIQVLDPQQQRHEVEPGNLQRFPNERFPPLTATCRLRQGRYERDIRTSSSFFSGLKNFRNRQ
jgi:hypothetical protein